MTIKMTIEQSAGLLAQELLGQFIQGQQPFCAGIEGQMIHVNENTSFLDLKNKILDIFEANSSFELNEEKAQVLKAKMTAILEDSFALTLLEIDSEEDFEEVMYDLNEIHEDLLDELNQYQEIDEDQGEQQEEKEEENNGAYNLINLLMNMQKNGLEGLLSGVVEQFTSKEENKASAFSFGTVSSKDSELEEKAKEIFHNTLKEVTAGKLHPSEATETFLKNLKVLGKDIEVNFFS